MATHSSILAWRIPWTEEPGGLQSVGSQRVRHDWLIHTHTHTHTHTYILVPFMVDVGFHGDSDGKQSACNAGVAGSISWSDRSPREGNCNSLQCSCLENCMDRRAWQAIVHRVELQIVGHDWETNTHTHMMKVYLLHHKIFNQWWVFFPFLDWSVSWNFIP